MTTRRERLEARLAKRRDWQASRERKSTQAFDAAHKIVEAIPLGQPILVGHHSERRHRAAIDRMASKMNAGCESADMAKHHAAKANGIEHALESSIFSDDPDAVEALEARIASLEAEREEKRKLGAAWRKAKKPKAADAEGWARVCATLGWVYGDKLCLRAMRDCASEEGFLNRGPVPSYVLSNLGGNISRLRKRVEDVKRRQERAARAEAAGGCCVEVANGYAQVTFTDYPGRAIVDALKAAGFNWSGGSWFGKADKIPAEVQP